MRIGSLNNIYPTYVYNPNVVSSKSMNRLSKISDDVLDKKVDYTGIRAEEENQNPLKKGQTIDFKGILAKQMQQGQNRAARIMPGGMTPAEKASETETTQMPQQKEAGRTRPAEESVTEKTADKTAENNASSMQMQRAIQAYEMFMTA